MTRRPGWPTPWPSSAALAASGVRTIVDPTVIGLGPLHPPHPAGGRAGARPQHRGGHRLLHVPRRPVLLPPPHARPSARSSDGRSPSRWCPCSWRDITEGIAGTGVRAGMLKCAIDEAGPDPRGRAGDAGRGPGPPGHRVPDHRPHPPRHRAGPRRAAGDGRGGRRPRAESCSGTAATRPTSTTSPPWPRPASGWGWTGSASTSRPRSRPGPTPSSNCAGGATPSAWCCPTTPPATSTGWTPRRCPFLPAVALPPHRPGRAALPARPRRHRGADHHHAGRQPPPDLRRVAEGGPRYAPAREAVRLRG